MGKIRKSIKVGLDVANDGKCPVLIFYEALDGNSSGYVETIRNMENLKKCMKLDRIVRILEYFDVYCYSDAVIGRKKLLFQNPLDRWQTEIYRRLGLSPPV